MFCTPSSLWGSCTSFRPETPKPQSKAEVKSEKHSKCKMDALNLKCIGENISVKEGWRIKRIAKAEKEYREFLNLLIEHKSKKIVPWNNDLDVFWHYHILDTQKYHQDCDKIFGYYLHHDPKVADKIEHMIAVKKTKELLKSHKKEEK